MKKTTSALQTWQKVNCKSILSSVGLVLKALSNILANGKCCITPILIVPNSVQLKMQQEATISVKTWIERTNAIGIRSKAGRYGGTYAHRDIAYHFGMWISPKFQLLLVKEYQRLKAE